MKSKKLLIFVILVSLVLAALYYFTIQRELKCSSFSVDKCPDECVVCPPCEVCSSVSCQTEAFCRKMGFNRSWYEDMVVK
ncbi:MAG: hypothetical protein QXJ06_05585 [Candidatus Aenigmatarchaeota archaeon]